MLKLQGALLVKGFCLVNVIAGIISTVGLNPLPPPPLQFSPRTQRLAMSVQQLPESFRHRNQVWA